MEKTPEKSIYICKRPWDTPEIIECFDTIVAFLFSRTDIRYTIYLENSMKPYESLQRHISATPERVVFFETIRASQISYVITIGGDGTILWAHKQFQEEDIPPFLSFNGGTLCFLSSHPVAEAQRYIEVFHAGVAQDKAFQMKSLPRLMTFKVQQGQECDFFLRFVLNDVVIERATLSMVTLDLYINDCYAIPIRSDGLVISSSTGSTAYNLSLANGVIMNNNVECMIINPMASMSLSSRPIILPKTCKIKIGFSKESRSESRIVYDGAFEVKFGKGDELVVENCPQAMRMIQLIESNEYADWIRKLKEIRGWQ
jgi:NAD+ kinase